MSKPKQHDLANFQNWLLKHKSIAPRSASVYASRIRKILAVPGTMSTAHLDELLNAEWTAQSRDSYYTSWNRFVEWAKEERKLTLPSPSHRSKPRHSRRKYAVPPAVLDALLSLLKQAYLKLSIVPSVRWKHIKRIPNAKTWEMVDPHNSSLYYRIPIDDTLIIYDWGSSGEPAPESPLIPIRPNYRAPIPISSLRRIIQEHKHSPIRSGPV